MGSSDEALLAGLAAGDPDASAELIARDGRRIPLRSFELADGAWGGSLPVRLEDVAAVQLLGADGRPVLVARSS